MKQLGTNVVEGGSSGDKVSHPHGRIQVVIIIEMRQVLMYSIQGCHVITYNMSERQLTNHANVGHHSLSTCLVKLKAPDHCVQLLFVNVT